MNAMNLRHGSCDNGTQEAAECGHNTHTPPFSLSQDFIKLLKVLRDVPAPTRPSQCLEWLCTLRNAYERGGPSHVG